MLSIVIAVFVAIILIIRKLIDESQNIYLHKISDRPSVRKTDCDDEKQSNITKQNDSFQLDFEKELEIYFANVYITHSLGEKFISNYIDIYNEAFALYRRLVRFGIKVSPLIVKLLRDFEGRYGLIAGHNEALICKWLNDYGDFFDKCLKYPLDRQQRRSIVVEDDNCLVISSAGSGKTSSIVGKVKYLTEIKKIDPQKILLISYTNKAAAELTERMEISGLRGYTFHKLAIDIIGKTTGAKPSICDNTDAMLINIYRELLNNNERFKRSVIEYFIDYQPKNNTEQLKDEKRQQLSELKNVRFKAALPDMDGRVIYVRSEQERKLCFVLSALGVKFRYEEPYEYQLADEKHSQYRPDFSIWYESNGMCKRIYLEHFGVNERGLVPVWFAEDKNMSYEEANQRYNDGITWKKAAHTKYNTQLIVTSSADFYKNDIYERVKELLIDAGVPIRERSNTELYDMIIPANSKREKVFIRLAATFVTLLKSSCRSISDVLNAVEDADDERADFIIRNIFLPIYHKYVDDLFHNGQIDFTDAILQATEICKSVNTINYDYIIVDEFQDISVDRYNFLKALRAGGGRTAKLYCVGDDWQSIYRFSGSDMALFNHFSDYFGATYICKIETTYRFGQPLVDQSSKFICRNRRQIQKRIRPFNATARTELVFYAYDKNNYCRTIEILLSYVPMRKSVLLLGRYSFDDILLSDSYKSVKEGNRFYYIINDRKVEFLTVHKSKGLEADYVILLQCNNDTYGFPSQISDDPILNYVLTDSDAYPFGEERRLFYVAITRAKEKTFVLYNKDYPSVFVNEFLHPEKTEEVRYTNHPNANKKWTPKADAFLLTLYREGKSIKEIAMKMGRSQTSIVMRLGKLTERKRSN